MKSYIYAFLLGIAVTICFAATTTDLLTIKPAKPISTIAVSGVHWKVTEKVNELSKQGYQVHSVTATTTANEMVVIMEKY